MKKTLSFFLAALLCVLLFGCALQTPITLGEEHLLPSDGIVSEATLSALKTQRKVLTLRGTADGFDYTWTLFGEEIETPKDCNFSLRSIKANKKTITLKFASKEPFGFSPLLTLFLPQRLHADVAAVYRASVQESNFVCAASVTVGDSGGAVSFAVDDPTGTYVIVPQKTQAEFAAPAEEDADDAPSVSAEPTATAAQENTTAPAVTVAAATTREVQRTSAAKTTTPATTAKQPTAKTTAPAAAPVTTTTTTTTAPASESAAKGGECTFSVECATIFQHLDALAPGKLDALPSDGVILAAQSVSFSAGESVFDVLQRVCRENKIPMEASFVPLYHSAYVEGIHNLYEFDCGEGSGWMYRVNGWYPNYGCSRYMLKDGDTVEFRYTCDLGADVGGRNDYTIDDSID
ncbi:MAG: DUF4430 domain-containing protein [Clostridia bacterium]|nr:DUF4430 domain-containing protein [Clostridia bacterium]